MLRVETLTIMFAVRVSALAGPSGNAHVPRVSRQTIAARAAGEESVRTLYVGSRGEHMPRPLLHDTPASPGTPDI